MKKLLLCSTAALAIATLASPAPAAAANWEFEVFGGYFLPEELDEDLTYGLRFGHRGDGDWGWQIGTSWFDVADSQGFTGKTVDADVFHVDFSLAWYPNDSGFSVFFGPGFASGNVDVPGVTTDLSDDVFSAHAGIAYEFKAGESFYVKPDLRARFYEMEGFGPDGGRQNQINYEATVALGWKFGG